MLRLSAALIALGWLFAASVSAQQATNLQFRSYREPKGNYRVDVPKVWVIEENLAQPQVVSSFFRGRETLAGKEVSVDVAVSVTKLPRRPEYFPSREEYERFRLSTLLQVDALFGPPDPELQEPLRSLVAKNAQDITLAGIRGKLYRREYDYADPRLPGAKPLPLRVEDVVLRTPETYYILEYRARRDLFDKYYIAANRLKASFRPGRSAIPEVRLLTTEGAAIRFGDLAGRWHKSQDLEERLALGEELLALEPRVNEWPLQQSRQEFKAGLFAVLGYDYSQRREGNRSDSLEKSITYLEASLTILVRDVSPGLWGITHFNLATIYLERMRGERADNLEKAIVHLEAALSAQTREVVPQEWVKTQRYLGIAYGNRIRGERADNLEKAIAHLGAALSIRTRDADPFGWAALQNSLGIIYYHRIYGTRAENVEKAIGAYDAALTVIERTKFPTDWAGVQMNRANAFDIRVRGDRAENQEKAIAGYEAALGALTRAASPRPWALAQYNLGKTYSNRIRGQRASNVEKAIAHNTAALSVLTQDEAPQEWVVTQNNLGHAYLTRTQGDSSENIGKAIAAFEAALTIATRDALPREHLRITRNLGRAYLKLKEWRKAGFAYAMAREAFLLLFGQGLNEAEAGDLIADAGPLFAEAAFAAAQRGEAEAALTLANEGRARLMAVSLKLQDLAVAGQKRQRLDDLRKAIRTEQHAVEATQGTERAAAVDKLVKLRQELLGLVKDAAIAESRPGLALARARAVVPVGGALVLTILTDLGAKVLIVTAAGTDQSLTVLDLPELTTDRLNVLMRGDGKTGGWFATYAIHYLQGNEFDRRWPEWLAGVDELGPQLWRLFANRLDAALKESGMKPGAPLVWLPSGVLGILPLGLAQDPASRRRLADDYEIVYALSLEALASAQAQVVRPTSASLAAIINPTGDLSGTEKEGRLVASYFADKDRTVLERTAATPEAVLAALKGKTHWHFASHGTFSWQDARQSALLMNGKAPLTVGRLLETDGLGRPRLVVLSACETGLYDIGSSPEEFIGLPGTFTALGAAAVVGTLWPVSDAATALLMAKFYELHMGQQLLPRTALNRAQGWLRQATSTELQGYARLAASQGRLSSRHIAEIEQELSEEGLKRARKNATVERSVPAPAGGGTSGSVAELPRPYGHPNFWAGFIHTGL